MKKILAAITIIAFSGYWFLAWPTAVFAADATEPFTGYTGTLVGENGGTGWGEAWQDHADGVDWDITVSGQSGDGINGDAGASDSANDRNLTAGITNGSGTFYQNQVLGSGWGNLYFMDTTGATERFRIGYQRSGIGTAIQLVALTTAGLGNWTTNTWHYVDIEFGDTGGSGTCAANEVRARLDAGTWSSCLAFANNGTVGNIRAFAGSGGTDYSHSMDTFTITDADAVSVATPISSLWWILRNGF